MSTDDCPNCGGEILETVKGIDVLLRGGPNSPGMLTRVDRLEQSEERRKRQIKALWAATGGTILAALHSFIFGDIKHGG